MKKHGEVLYPSKHKESPATSYIYVRTDIAKMNIKLYRSS